jgi:hypothetical protein
MADRPPKERPFGHRKIASNFLEFDLPEPVEETRDVDAIADCR